jgi:hypothetical protein
MINLKKHDPAQTQPDQVESNLLEIIAQRRFNKQYYDIAHVKSALSQYVIQSQYQPVIDALMRLEEEGYIVTPVKMPQNSFPSSPTFFHNAFGNVAGLSIACISSQTR